MFLPASVFVHNPDTTEEAYNHLHHWLWLDDVGWRHCKCHVRAKIKGDAEVRFSSFLQNHILSFLARTCLFRTGRYSRYESNGIGLPFDFLLKKKSILKAKRVLGISSQGLVSVINRLLRSHDCCLASGGTPVAAIFDGFPAACLIWDSVPSPKVDVAQGTVKNRPKDSCQVVVEDQASTFQAKCSQ